MDEDDIEDPPVEALSGGLAGVGEDSLYGFTVEVLCAVRKLGLLLEDMDEEAYAPIAKKVQRLKDEVNAFAAPKPTRRVGFKVRTKRRRR